MNKDIYMYMYACIVTVLLHQFQSICDWQQTVTFSSYICKIWEYITKDKFCHCMCCMYMHSYSECVH